MTRSRTNAGKLLFGFLGTAAGASPVLSSWHQRFLKKNVDASMNRYSASKEDIPELLSEMYHFDRRGYIVSLSLQKAIIPYLDALDSSATGEGSVDTIVNDQGKLIGYFVENNDDVRWQVWMGD